MNKLSNKDKNVILITIDCLRADHIHCMGYNKNITPNIDKLATDGILFSNAFSNAPYTPYSIPSFIMSQLPPIKSGKKVTIAQALKNHGYSTAAFNPNPIILSDTFEGYDIRHGFDTYDIMLNSKMRCRLTVGFIRSRIMKYLKVRFAGKDKILSIIYHIYSKIIKTFPKLFLPKEHLIVPNAELINEEAISWIRNQKGKFFLWLHYMDVHEPYVPKDYDNQNELSYLITKYRDFPNMITEQEKEKIINLYDLEISYVDGEMGKLIKFLKEQNYLQNSILIITSDHGEEFSEHGAYGHGGKFRAQLYDESIHIPLIIFGLEESGTVIEKQVQLLDLSPTICEILKIPTPNSFFGKSLFNNCSNGIIVNSEYDIAYRTKNYKLIIRKNDGNSIELYNLKIDPYELNNIYTNDETFKRLELEMMNIIYNYNNKLKLSKNNLKQIN